MTPPPSGLAKAAGPLRRETAAASSICQISPTRCQARTRLYRDGTLELEGFPVADISEKLEELDTIVWLDLRDPTTMTSRCSATSSACTRWPSRTPCWTTSGPSSTATAATCS